MKMGWFVFALIAMLSFTVTFLIVRKLGDSGIKTEVILFYYFLIAAIVLFIYSTSIATPLRVSKVPLILLLVVGIVGAVANIFLIQSLTTSPNPGYSLAISGGHILLVAILSTFIFNSEFTLTKSIGTILTIVGIILIGLKS